jgi:hypothetical protein
LGGVGHTIDGSLLIADRHAGSAIEMTIAVEGIPFPVASTLHYNATTLIPTPDGIWLLNGDLIAGAVTRPQRAIVRYHGVYRYGDRAAAWLTLNARIDLADYLGRRPFAGRHLLLTADLNTDCPTVCAPALRRACAG